LDQESIRRQSEFSLEPAFAKRRRPAVSDESTQEESQEIANSYDLASSAQKPRRRWVPCRRFGVTVAA
jgi:hypothetical protein